MFCVTLLQSDAISTLEKEMDYKEERFDFIQQHVRKICLNCILSTFFSPSLDVYLYNNIHTVHTESIHQQLGLHS